MKIVLFIGNPSPPLIYFVNKINELNLTQYDVPMEVPTVEPLSINKGIVQGDNIEGVPFSARIVKPNGKNNGRIRKPSR